MFRPLALVLAVVISALLTTAATTQVFAAGTIGAIA
jgi:hypothetical protein